ncbi:NmrA family NAD(P)-binding protein [Streptomyces violaceochromogenes]|uniref:NmrA family NAD(P)-binding protein n=1 Tax=Streptomyces violaceochromogenes TaxID=67377 RepID=A0ABU6LN40_9ACTN|nr:NmrA family NAD(P)-binding protein [Streptomyces violaceochromogenes]MEC7050920.1 NmrA family NAD(P)-binding protein [Streptomyces violaceochromogenes]GHC85530.1 hydroxylase [Streptomyces violaceochromogenes]
MTYVIHGATGAQGAPVVAALAAAGQSVTALTRNADVVVAGAQRVVAADYGSTAELTEAYGGADGVFVHLPVVSEEDRRDYARNIVAAVRAARPARVVFSAGGAPIDPETSGAAAALAGGLAETGVPHAVITPTLFLENLLMPYVLDTVRERGALPYPIRAGFPVSWASHLDIADAVVALFDRPDITGVVSVGQYPAITGPDLAEAFGAHFGKDVVFEQITPEQFRSSVAPLIGEGPAADVAGAYAAMSALPDRSITPENSAQKLLGITPRTTGQWLTDMGL